MGRAAGAPGVYLAGDGAGVAGADAAELRGELAALALIEDLGGSIAHERVQRLRRRLDRLQRFRRGLEAAFPFPAHLMTDLPDDTLLCRCEGVTLAQFREAVRLGEAEEINRAKAFSRVGMGRCQGRVCAPAAALALADRCRLPVEQIGRMRGQPPVKPLAVGLLAAGVGGAPS
jgi:hypothetical protein